MRTSSHPQRANDRLIKKPDPKAGQTYTRGGRSVRGDHLCNCNLSLSHLLSRRANKRPVNAIVELFTADFAAGEFFDLWALLRSDRPFAG